MSTEDCRVAAKISGCIPGFMSKTLEDLWKNVHTEILWEGERIFPSLSSNNWRTKQHIKLFIAILHRLPLAAIDLSVNDAENLI